MRSTPPLYFAYGSNLARGPVHEHLEPVGPAWLPDHRLAFTRRSKRWNGGALDVVEARGSVVPGFLFRATDAGWAALDEKEGAPRAYERYRCWATTDAGELVPVCTYRVRDKEPHVAPKEPYLDLVRLGREQRDLGTGDLERVAAGDAHANELPSLFVYGTLMRAEPRARALAEHEPACWILAEAFGDLYDCGDFPGFVFDTTGRGRDLVQGEFVRFASGRIAGVLASLDRIEAFRGYAASASLFHRVPLFVGVGDGRVRHAWTYVLTDTTAHRAIACRDWREHRGVAVSFKKRLARAHLAGTSGDADDIARALISGALSERRLAQRTNRWAVVPDEAPEVPPVAAG